MKRLTYKFYPLEKAYLVRGQDAIWSKKLKNSSYELITNAIDRLAAYEDIGLEPEEIKDHAYGTIRVVFCPQCGKRLEVKP